MPQVKKLIRPGSPVLFSLCIVLIVGTGAYDDQRSCERSDAVRGASRAYFAGVAERALDRATVDRGPAQRIDWASYDAARHAVLVNRDLDCSLPTPDTH